MDLPVDFLLNGYVLKMFTAIRNGQYAKYTKEGLIRHCIRIE